MRCKRSEGRTEGTPHNPIRTPAAAPGYTLLVCMQVISSPLITPATLSLRTSRAIVDAPDMKPK